MIAKDSIAGYHGITFERGGSYLYLPPHPLLRPCISHYTFSFPTPQTMPDEYTVLPSASSTLTMCVGDDGVRIALRGVDTKALRVGAHANKLKLLVLIEFMPGGMRPFLPVDQWELADSSFTMDELDGSLKAALEREPMEAGSVAALVAALDGIFLSRLREHDADVRIAAMLRHICLRHGSVDAQGLSSTFNYSTKQLRRLFRHHVGVSPKTFSRIVRVNHALRRMQRHPQSFADVALEAGYFDQPHMIHDFKRICGVAPQTYLQNMSLFYNDTYKL